MHCNARQHVDYSFTLGTVLAITSSSELHFRLVSAHWKDKEVLFQMKVVSLNLESILLVKNLL